MFPNILKSRRDALDDLFEKLSSEEYDIAEDAIDLFIDYLESYMAQSEEGV